jgi:nitroimidazol reductase NimA-like FMN-containing flavoprotein (pyridoxamine 5'-phosphate oxidase superfamily)
MRRKERAISDNDIIEEIIMKADVCRIAISNNNIPYIVTMNFGYSGGMDKSIYFHCANEGKKLDMISKNNHVCFEMDIDHQIYTGEKGCDWGMKYKSVVGYGDISIIEDYETKKTGLTCIMRHYGGSKEFLFDEDMIIKTTILRLDIKEINGKIC